MIKDAASKFSQEVVKPKVREMDEKEQLDPIILKQLFDQGYMGLDISSEFGGSECNYMSLVLAVEELSKIDPAVGTTVDVHV